MEPSWDTAGKLLLQHAWPVAVALFGILSGAIAAYLRKEVRTGTDWVLAPISKALPWNEGRPDPTDFAPLSSQCTLIDVFLLDAAGTRARYQKTSFYVAERDLVTFQEGVTAEGRADAFSTMRGTIASTTREHGFYLSRIHLDVPLTKSGVLTNTYLAELHNCFTSPREHWTQEILYPTERLSLRIHFPSGRLPKSVTCEVQKGSCSRLLSTRAEIVELTGNRSIVWELERPDMGEVFKVEWLW